MSSSPLLAPALPGGTPRGGGGDAASSLRAATSSGGGGTGGVWQNGGGGEGGGAGGGVGGEGGGSGGGVGGGGLGGGGGGGMMTLAVTDAEAAQQFAVGGSLLVHDGCHEGHFHSEGWLGRGLYGGVQHRREFIGAF